MPPKKKPLLSGQCKQGWHEGLKPKDWRGNPAPCCHWEKCGCPCHVTMAAMQESAGVPRTFADNPEYKPDRGDFVLPDPLDRVDSTVLSSTGGTNDHPDTERPSRAIPDPVAGVSFAPTESGRRARGQLEYEVLAVCRRWLADEFDWPACYPKYIVEVIDKADPPSTGAVTAVFARWEKMGFAEYQHKPIAFLKFIDNNGTAEELSRAKASAKRSVKMARSNARRGVR